MESEIIPITWYIEPPIDFEHKQYVLYAYLQRVDESFVKKILSPHYLYLGKILDELNTFNYALIDANNQIKKTKYIFFSNEKEYESNIFIDEIKEIIEFSIPQIQLRIRMGDKILEKNKQVLY